ncbi:MAG: hypothetical protein QM831_02855 [Kofleriaceae bacterium]
MRWAWILAITACGTNGTYEIKSDVKSSEKSQEGLPGDPLPTYADAAPKLTVTGIADRATSLAMEATIAKAKRADKGAITIDVKGVTGSPSGSGTLDATVTGHAVFAHAPKITVADATFTIHLDYKRASEDNIGESLGQPVAKWLDALKLPAQVGLPPAPAKVVGIAAGPPSCSLHADGNVRCWREGIAPLPIDAHDTIAIAAANNFGACGIRKDGSAWCTEAWGGSISFEVRDVCGVHDAIQISVGQSDACALLKTGQVTCWPKGEASFAPCNGTATETTLAGLGDATAIYVGAFDGCAIKKDGSVVCWPNIDPAHPPVVKPVKELTGATSIAYAYQPCALIGDTKIQCAAAKMDKAVTYTVPEPAKAIVATTTLCALSVAGNLYCAGTDGKLEKQPVTDIVTYAGGIADNCAVVKSGGVTCWGGLGGDKAPKPVVLQ